MADVALASGAATPAIEAKVAMNRAISKDVAVDAVDAVDAINAVHAVGDRILDPSPECIPAR